MALKIQKEEVVGPPLRGLIVEPCETLDLRKSEGDFLHFPTNPIKFLVMVGISPSGYTFDNEFVYFLLTPTKDGPAEDCAYHANLLKAFVEGNGEFTELKHTLKNIIDLTLDMRRFVFFVAGGGLLYQRGVCIIADEESRDFGPFSRLRVKKLLKNVGERTGKRTLVLGTSDSASEFFPLRNFHL